jgi:hypothetical protein
MFSNAVCNDNIPSSSVSIPFAKEEKMVISKTETYFSCHHLVYLQKKLLLSCCLRKEKNRGKKERNIK